MLKAVDASTLTALDLVSMGAARDSGKSSAVRLDRARLSTRDLRR